MSTRVLFCHDATAYPASARCLRLEGYDVDLAQPAEAGLDRLGGGRYDIIIVQAPAGAPSWQLCAQIRQVSPRPLLVISADASADTCVRAIGAGADCFLRKPFGPLELRARVRSLLQRAAPRPPVAAA